MVSVERRPREVGSAAGECGAVEEQAPRAFSIARRGDQAGRSPKRAAHRCLTGRRGARDLAASELGKWQSSPDDYGGPTLELPAAVGAPRPNEPTDRAELLGIDRTTPPALRVRLGSAARARREPLRAGARGARRRPTIG